MSESKKQRKWVREEVVILVTEYFKTKNLSAEEISDNHQMISAFLRKREEMLTGLPVADIFRNYAGIHMQSEEYVVWIQTHSIQECRELNFKKK